jgi:putative DNA primase/helicase
MHAAEIARAVGGAYVELPADWPPNYDINDFHNETRSLKEVAALLKSAKFPDTPEASVVAPDRGNTLNDSGNAARLVKLFGHEIRWRPETKEWITWNGQFWVADKNGAVIRFATATAQSIYREAQEETDADKARSIGRWAGTSLSLQRITAMVELAKAELNISILMSSLDQKNMLLGTPSGVVDLTTGLLSKANRFDYITRTTTAEYQLDATCPNWEKFLERCFPGNRKLIEFIQRAVGYCLTGLTNEQVMFLLIGDGCNGKSVFLETIRAVFGAYAMQTQADTLIERTKGHATNDIARLNGTRMVSVIEIEKGRRLAESFVKQLTGGDQISARFLYGEFFEFKPTFKFWLAANDEPVITGTDHGIWRRICLIPFTVRIPPEEQDKQLSIKLAAEAAGILQWAIRGALEWQRIGLCPPQDVKQATDQYQADMDVFRNWLDECCRQGPKEWARAQDLIRSHGNWAEQNDRLPLNAKELSNRLQANGFHKQEDRQSNKYLGLSLL